MRKLNLKVAGIFTFSLLSISTFAQDWMVGGNNNGQLGGALQPRLGTNGNRPLIFETNNTLRMHINQDGTSYLGLNTSGFVGVNTSAPRSMLHLNGPNNTLFGGAGWRTWMRTGLLSLENSDNLYVGMKEEGINRSDAVICFGDDNGGAPSNNLRFMFGGISSNGNDPVLELGRFTAAGNFGVGPVFTNPQQPQSLVHLNRNGNQNTFLQITNQNGTGQTAQDGLRLGIVHPGNPNNQFGAIGYQENRPLRFFTDWNNTPGGIIQGERLRISAVSAPGVPNPGNVFAANTTRVAISHNGSSPITAPRSLLHLGYNTGTLTGPGGIADGWRTWMDVGTFTAAGSDNMYVGLKPEGTDRYDAIINWGDNQAPGLFGPNGPDNLRFIFTSTTTAFPPGQGDPVSQSADGLEVGRFFPGRDTLGTYGRLGVGDFTVQGVNEAPTHKLDVIGNGRFRFLPDSIYMADSLVDKVVMVDSSGVLRWKDADDFGGGVGNFCADPQVPVSSDYEIALDSANYYFSKQGNSINAVGIGLPCGTPILFSRLQVLQSSPNPLFNPGISIAGQFNNTAGGILAIGTYGDATGSANQHIGGYFSASGGSNNNFGVYCTAPVVPPTPGNPSDNLALYADGDAYVSGIAFISQPAQIVSDQLFKTNVDSIQDAMGIINQLQPKTYEYDTSFGSRIHFQQGTQYGLIAQEVESVLPDLVMESTIPAEFDSLGNVVNPAIPYKSLNYNAFIAILMKGMQEQNKQISEKDSTINVLEEQVEQQDSTINALEIQAVEQDSLVDDLNQRLTQLENCLGGILPLLCQINNTAIEENNDATQQKLMEVINVELTNKDNIVLNQNVPNPFAEQTSISYYLPDNVNDAYISFYNNAGQLINKVTLNNRGAGKINVYGNDLSSGIYTYTLIVDGQIIKTHKLVKN